MAHCGDFFVQIRDENSIMALCQMRLLPRDTKEAITFSTSPFLHDTFPIQRRATRSMFTSIARRSALYPNTRTALRVYGPMPDSCPSNSGDRGAIPPYFLTIVCAMRCT